MLLLADQWKDYELIDMGNGEKLERWGNYVLRRPDPQVVWPMEAEWSLWKNPHGHYHRSNKGGGQWEHKKKYPEQWTISYKDLKFHIKPTGFKHTGLFPEQAANWEWSMDKIRNAKRPIKVLNLFAYTGTQAKDNIKLSGLEDRKVRFIVDDVVKFVEREIRRGNKYDAIIMDPPSYGRGPKGEVWQIEEKLFDFVNLCMKVLSDKPLFFLINSYTTGFSPIVLENVLQTTIGKKVKGGKIYGGELGIPASRDGKILPCGIFGRWESK